ncbi:hypothetical protein EYF80_032644 [Liparis tanakae]|uniref:Uncharacterized protein n=1 Tax=Liparis tanakae TaxID=230148 RepID=A0A4Z2GUV0_9TELE|nr:hypothetical protein EYF80_032644 [Liparis tanakae]
MLLPTVLVKYRGISIRVCRPAATALHLNPRSVPASHICTGRRGGFEGIVSQGGSCAREEGDEHNGHKVLHAIPSTANTKALRVTFDRVLFIYFVLLSDHQFGCIRAPFLGAPV